MIYINTLNSLMVNLSKEYHMIYINTLNSLMVNLSKEYIIYINTLNTLMVTGKSVKRILYDLHQHTQLTNGITHKHSVKKVSNKFSVCPTVYMYSTKCRWKLSLQVWVCGNSLLIQ